MTWKVFNIADIEYNTPFFALVLERDNFIPVSLVRGRHKENQNDIFFSTLPHGDNLVCLDPALIRYWMKPPVVEIENTAVIQDADFEVIRPIEEPASTAIN